LVLTEYTITARNFITNSINDMVKWMEIAYQTAYDFFVEYFNPVVWYEEVYKGLADGVIWIQSLFLSEEERNRLAAERVLREK